MAESTAFIRPYKPEDKAAMIHIFNETAAPDLRAGGDAILHLASYNWCRPYIFLEPQNCFVVDNGDGQAVGYVIGTPDTKSFVQEYNKLYLPHLESEGVHKPGVGESVEWSENLPNALANIAHSPEGMLQGDFPDLLKQFQGHLHIDILPSHQHAGWGKKLLQHFCDHMAGQGSAGVYLGMVSSNENAHGFYDHIGFGRYPHVLDGGMSGELGRKDNTVFRVKRLA
jgi:ribosomal protein S18 acetylase RimI-like enzyme